MAVRIGTTLLLLLLCGITADGESKRTSPTVAREAAESNAKTPAGKRYETALEARLDTWLKKALERCVRGVSKDELVSFDALVRIGGSGEAEEVVFGRETAVSRCVEQDLRAEKYPTPPQPSWWVDIEVRLK